MHSPSTSEISKSRDLDYIQPITGFLGDWHADQGDAMLDRCRHLPVTLARPPGQAVVDERVDAESVGLRLSGLTANCQSDPRLHDRAVDLHDRLARTGPATAQMIRRIDDDVLRSWVYEETAMVPVQTIADTLQKLAEQSLVYGPQSGRQYPVTIPTGDMI